MPIKFELLRTIRQTTETPSSPPKPLLPRRAGLILILAASGSLSAAIFLLNKEGASTADESKTDSSLVGASSASLPSCDAMVIEFDERGLPFNRGSRRMLGLECSVPTEPQNPNQERAGYPDGQPPDSGPGFIPE